MRMDEYRMDRMVLMVDVSGGWVLASLQVPLSLRGQYL